MIFTAIQTKSYWPDLGGLPSGSDGEGAGGNERASAEVLKLLNSNTRNPYIVWDNSTRAELTDFIEEERTSSVRRGTCDPSFGAEFKFSAHKDQLVVGNIFVKIYNEQPDFQVINSFFSLFAFWLKLIQLSGRQIIDHSSGWFSFVASSNSVALVSDPERAF